MTVAEKKVGTADRTDYHDRDLTFFMLVYEDYEAADACLRGLRQHFPEARVVVRSDGDTDPRYRSFVTRYHADYRAEERLFPVENGGAIIERMFEIFFEQPSPYLFKIDPDTVVHRRFRYLPAHRAHFGTLEGGPGYVAVQGGCMGFTSDAAAQIAQSGLLRDNRLKNPQAHREWSMYWHKLAKRADRLGLSSFDWTLGWAASTLSIPLLDFPEVRSAWKTPVDNPERRYAITHPAPSTLPRT